LKTLKTAGIPLTFNEQAKRYSIESGTFGPPSDLTAEEALSLWVLAHSVNSLPHFPLYESAQTAMVKIRRGLPSNVRKKLGKTVPNISFARAKVGSASINAEIYKQVVEAIEKRQAVQITYESLTEWDQIETKLRPYHLLFCERTWYAIGHSSCHGEVRNFNVSRIKSLKQLSGRYSIPRDFSVDQRRKNAWIMNPETGPDSHVVVKFDSMVAQNVAEICWHKTQKTQMMPGGSLIYRATVSGLNEIVWWILAYGDRAEVIQPASLRRMVAQRAQNMVDIYSGKKKSAR
jgi:predicted DNA-binding transcriptional regulator YafY